MSTLQTSCFALAIAFDIDLIGKTAKAIRRSDVAEGAVQSDFIVMRNPGSNLSFRLVKIAG